MLSAIARLLRRLCLGRPLLEINSDLWHEVLVELCNRGCMGQRESGAFLLSERQGTSRRVVRIVYFDDLDPDCLVGNIQFKNSSGYSRLWDICEAEGLRVVADVHTHPAQSVTQSSVDRMNPMIAQVGHIALIVPHYSMHFVRASDLGVHEYHGNAGWRSLFGRDAARAFKIRSDR